MLLRGSLFSQALEMETGISLIAPVGSGDGPYKAVYLLHGLCGRNSDWLNFTQLPYWAREYGAFFIMPEVGRSFYTDMAYGQQYFTYVAEELPAYCEKRFAISPARKDTAVMGVSMGGYGALKCALRHPERFGCCCSFSAACLFLAEGLAAIREPGGEKRAEELYGQQLVTDFRAAFGTDFASDPGNDLTTLAQAVAGQNDLPRFYAACGSEDSLLAENTRFRDEMHRLKMPFVFESWPGAHDWFFFNQALKRGLDFLWRNDDDLHSHLRRDKRRNA